MSEEKKEGYELLQSKVSTKAAERLNRIARNRGTTTYGLIQLVCQFLIRTASGEYNLSDEINRLLTLFHLEPGWKDAYNSCDPTADTEIAQEILILQQPGRRGFGAVMVNKPFMGAWTETECVDDIIERIIEVCAPGVHKRLKRLCEIHESESILELLVLLTDAQVIVDLDEANRQEIQQADNIMSNGRAMVYGARTRRKKHYDPDTMPQQIVFEDFDRDMGTEQLDEMEGLHHDTR